MREWRRICKKLLFPPAWLMVILAVICTASLAAVFLNGWDAAPIAYGIYVLAFYTLTVICVSCMSVFPRCFRNIRKRVYANKYGNRYMTDAAFKVHVSLYQSLSINLLYVAANLVSGYYYRTAWFVILAVYYTILAVMRFLLLRFVNRTGIGNNRVRELRHSRLCGMILMTINLVLSGAVLMMLYQNRGYEYHGVLIYVMAVYTFYITVHAVMNLVKYRKYHSPVMSTARVISMAAALVSMLALETAMLSQFGGDMTPEGKHVLIAATGGGISGIVISMSLYLIIRANKEIRNLKRINNSEI